jgi:hypothetical protein
MRGAGAAPFFHEGGSHPVGQVSWLSDHCLRASSLHARESDIGIAALRSAPRLQWRDRGLHRAAQRRNLLPLPYSPST